MPESHLPERRTRARQAAGGLGLWGGAGGMKGRRCRAGGGSGTPGEQPVQSLRPPPLGTSAKDSVLRAQSRKLLDDDQQIPPSQRRWDAAQPSWGGGLWRGFGRYPRRGTSWIPCRAPTGPQKGPVEGQPSSGARKGAMGTSMPACSVTKEPVAGLEQSMSLWPLGPYLGGGPTWGWPGAAHRRGLDSPWSSAGPSLSGRQGLE